MAADTGFEEALPRRLGRYVLLSRLTEGGMTEVYAARLAEEVGPGRVLVIKVLPLSVADDPEAELRFLSEARIVLNLTHGNITTAFEFGRDDAGRPFLVMEYVPGPSLRRLLLSIKREEKRLPVADGLFILAEVAKALSYAHTFSVAGESKQGIVHRDISPDNIVISTSGQVKLTDFGIAHFIQAQSFGPVFGKPAYIAPEVAVGKEPTTVSDLYSIGTILYECVAGELPFKGKDDRETLTLLKKEAYPKLSTSLNLPKKLTDLVDRLLVKEPGERLQSASEMEVLLRASLRECHPTYTESHLAQTVGAYFTPSDFMDPTPRESLVKSLIDAGIDLSGDESTDELLDNRTVPIALSDAPPPRRAASGRRRIWGVSGAALLMLLALAAWWMIPVSEKSEPANLSPQKTSPSIKKTKPEVVVLKEAPPLPKEAAEEPQQKVLPKKAGKPTKMGKAARKALHAKKAGEEPSQKNRTDAVHEWGWLNINSIPWSYVSVDGKRLDGHTPYRRVKLKAGFHTLVFQNPELKLRAQKKVEVVPFEEVNVGLRLSDQ